LPAGFLLTVPTHALCRRLVAVTGALALMPRGRLPVLINQADFHQAALEFLHFANLQTETNGHAALEHVESLLVIEDAFRLTAKDGHKMPTVLECEETHFVVVDDLVIHTEPRECLRHCRPP